MDLSFGPAYQEFRLEVRDFLAANWPPDGAANRLPTSEEISRFRDLATPAVHRERAAQLAGW